MPFHVVLYQPEIPQNTGSIARTCAVTGGKLHLIRPLGFSVEDRYLKRAGLDYWHMLDINYYDSLEELRLYFPEHCFFFFSTKGHKLHTELCFSGEPFLVFGRETEGLPKSLIEANRKNCFRIPMLPAARSLNLSNAVAVAVYEILRRSNFPGLI